MERDGLVVLPPPRNGNGNGNIARHGEAEAHLSVPIPASLQELGDISLVVVDTKVSSRHWRSLVASYHYLGYTPFAGAQLRYLSARSGHSASRLLRGPVRHAIPTSAGTLPPERPGCTSWLATPAS
jgi:hypothetical protein